MSELDEQVAELKERAAKAQREKALAEQQAAIAADRADTIAAAIREEFGTDPEGAAAVIRSLEADLAAETKRVQALLETAEGDT